MDLTTQTVPGDGHVTLRVSGELDLHTAASLRDAALEALRQHGTTMWLDLRELSFMDSTVSRYCSPPGVALSSRGAA